MGRILLTFGLTTAVLFGRRKKSIRSVLLWKQRGTPHPFLNRLTLVRVER